MFKDITPEELYHLKNQDHTLANVALQRNLKKQRFQAL